MKKLIPIIVTTALLFAVGQEAEAQLGVDIGPQLTYNAEVEEFGVGGRLEVSPVLMPLAFVGTADYLFLDCPGDCSFWEFGGSVKYTIALPGSPIGPYFGAGVTHQRIGDGDETEDDTGFNILGGIGLGGVMPIGAFAEGRYQLMNDFENQLTVAVGILF